MRRKAAVAGQFYHAAAQKLTQQVEEYVSARASKTRAIGVLSPHAGLIYSGATAGQVYSSIEMPETFILIGPNHTGLGASISLMREGEWEIPSGTLSIDERLANRIAADAPAVTADTQAHLFEHSLEVQLPFIRYFSKEAKIVPITVLSASLDDCRFLGRGIASAITGVGYPVVIVASSDMSHYVPEETARKKDSLAIEKILSLDPEGLYNTVRKEQITMCGYLPATIMLFAAKELGAREARLVKYATSAEASGDYDHVVGYAGMVIL